MADRDYFKLAAAVRAYSDSLLAVYNHVTEYLDAGGDATVISKEWYQLDELRKERYAAMLELAGVKPQ